MAVIDATDLLLGRMATRVAKRALLGERIDVVNCEKAMVSGGRANVYAKYTRIRNLGAALVGPYFPRLPDRFVRRVIRGMLPYKKPRGREAFERVMCHIGTPVAFKEKQAETFDQAKISKLPNLKYVSVHDICRHLGGK